jgi:hypothetical protein
MRHFLSTLCFAVLGVALTLGCSGNDTAKDSTRGDDNRGKEVGFPPKGDGKRGKDNGSASKGDGKRGGETGFTPKGPHIDVLVGAVNIGHFNDVKPGDTVKVKGEFLGKKQDGSIVMHIADRYKGDENAVKVADLLTEYATDAAAADKKYKDKELVLEGVLAEAGIAEIRLVGQK